MKKLLLAVALAVGAMGAAQAQVHFDSGSDRPNNPQAAAHFIKVDDRAHPPRRPPQRLVRCRDGSRRVAAMCRTHGGVRR